MQAQTFFAIFGLFASVSAGPAHAQGIGGLLGATTSQPRKPSAVQTPVQPGPVQSGGQDAAAVMSSPQGPPSLFESLRPALRTNESIMPFKDGKCAALGDAREPSSAPFVRKTSWVGRCPAGLADGPGLEIYPDGTSAKAEYTAGFAPTWRRRAGWRVAYSSTFLTDQPLLQFQSKNPLSLEKFLGDDEFELDVTEVNGLRVRYNLAIGRFRCPFKGYEGTASPVNLGQFEAAAKKACRLAESDYYSDAAYIASWRRVFNAPGEPPSSSDPDLELVVCDFVPNGHGGLQNSCGSAFQALIAPFRARLETAMAQQKALISAAQSDARERFGPFMAADKAHAQAIAARYATQASRSPLPDGGVRP